MPWNKGKLVGQKAPLKLSEIWSIRIRLQLSGKVRNRVGGREVVFAARRVRVLLQGPIEASKLDALARYYVDLYGKGKRESEVQFFLTKPASPDAQPWPISTVGDRVTTQILGGTSETDTAARCRRLLRAHERLAADAIVTR